MKVLALDLATVTGWAVGGTDAPTVTALEAAAGATAPGIRSGSIRIGHAGVSDARFFRDFVKWLDTMIGLERPGTIIYEAPIISAGKINAQTAFRLMGMAALTEYVGDRAGVDPVFSANIMQVKKHATGSGRATKTDMVAAARQRGWTPVDDNEADALWLLDYAIAALRRRRATKS